LDEVLDEDGTGEPMSLPGSETVKKCLDLRSSLLQFHRDIEITSKAPSTSSSQNQSHDLFNTPASISASTVTPWRASTIPTTLPLLPKVLDPTLEASAFIHLGLGSGAVTDLSYERLEFVGDAYIYLISTLLISQTFPHFTPGKSSQMRERLVKNLTLADYSRQYGFDKRARLPRELTGDSLLPVKEHEKTKALGDIFEAYVAAVILSDPADGVGRATDWLKGVWAMTIAKDIILQERSDFKMDSPMWRLRGSAEPVQEISAKTQHVPKNAKEQLQKLIGSKGIKITYRDAAAEAKDPNNKLALFTVGVYLDGWGEKDRMLGSGNANGKKDAGMKAAQMALNNHKLLRTYIEKKKVFDAQQEQERQALEQLGAT
jgi:ribonuclease-3